MGTPDDTFESISTDLVNEYQPVLGKSMLAIANGGMTFKRLRPLPNLREFVGCYGTIYTSAGTNSIVPTHPMGTDVADTTVSDSSLRHDPQRPTIVRVTWGGVPQATPVATTRGISPNPILQANPYGEYEKKYHLMQPWNNVTVDAARYTPGGQIIYYKAISDVRSLFQNENVDGLQLNIGGNGVKQLNLTMFRATEVACFQKINPKSFNAFPRFDFLDKLGMQAPENLHPDAAGPGITAFMTPDTQFYVAMMDGAANNPKIQTYRAFLLNVEKLDPLPSLDACKANPQALKPEPELFGNGYLAADTPNITYPYFDAAASMLRTNKKRLVLQQRYSMMEEQMKQSQELGESLLAQAKDKRFKEQDPFKAVNLAGKSLSCAITNHPVIRAKIKNAVFGIIWYLGILVPFVFFFEKLVFGFTDIRKQLLAVGIIFIIFFALLQTFHPAFRMVGSPMMILLGFIIFLLALVVTMMISGKFQQVVKQLRSKEGAVEGADVNRGGVIGTAFMLGLNNMRRRKVRTGLTCVTLVLITFVMICFTSVSTSLVEVVYPTGKSPANGIVRRDPNFMPITPAEQDNLKQIYGLDYPVAVDNWLVGGADATHKFNTQILVNREYVINGVKFQPKAENVQGAMIMPWNEWQFNGINRDLVIAKAGTNKLNPADQNEQSWFPRPPETKAEIDAAKQNNYVAKNYAILPQTMATKLNIKPEDITDAETTVTIQNETYVVWGLFDAQKVNNHLGMDGQSFLPYDLNSQTNQAGMATNAEAAQQQQTQTTKPRNIDRLTADNVIILSKAPTALEPGQQNIATYCYILLPSEPYFLRSDEKEPHQPVSTKEQTAVINEYLERLGIGAYYAKSNIAYYGYRSNKKTAEGWLELLIPILIAAFTVFNTMRGSVYERKDEIYVYNAVGIAPNHIFFMFMAEACVYAVMGAMLGYLLSQITGTVMVALHVTGGLNMDYSSIETIFASMIIVAAVLLSTLVPASTASRMALPSDEMNWNVPQQENGVMRFNLPFTFTAHDRIAVISYFYRWLDANGEGSSGSFFCAPPEPRIEIDEKEIASKGLIPGIESTIWLKPYDLGVSQRLIITLPTDPETGEYIAHITIQCLTGTMAAWERAVTPFLGALRKQFLNWRAVSDAEREEMFDEAKELLGQLELTTEETQETANV